MNTRLLALLLLLSMPKSKPVCAAVNYCATFEKAINGLLALAAKGEQIDSQNVRYIIKLVSQGREEKIPDLDRDVICVTAKGKPIKAKTIGQKEYVNAIMDNTVNDLEVRVLGEYTGDIAYYDEHGVSHDLDASKITVKDGYTYIKLPQMTGWGFDVVYTK